MIWVTFLSSRSAIAVEVDVGTEVYIDDRDGNRFNITKAASNGQSFRSSCALHLMSRQLGPRPTSATMGTVNSATCSISCWTRVLEFFGFGGDDVEEQFVVDLQGHAGAEVALR